MSDPRRWVEDGSTSDQLRAALQDYPRPGAIPAEALEALGNALGQATSVAPTATTGGGAVAKAALVKAGLVKIGPVSAALGIGGAGWYLVKSQPRLSVASSSHATSALVSTTLVVPPPVAEEAKVAEEPAIDTKPAEARNLANATKPVEARAWANPSADVETGKTSQLQLEATLLEGARKALASDPALALAQTKQHRARFKRPMLAFERDLVEMDALCRLGNAARAQRLANALFAVQPEGPYADRARAILARAGVASSNRE
jgi:hypothetical protein